MEKISASAILSEAWEYAKKHFLMMSIFLIVIFIISNVIQSLFGGPSYSEVQESIQSENPEEIIKAYSSIGPSYAISTLISTILTLGILNTTLCIVQGKKQKVDFSGYQMPVSQWVKLICASIVQSFILGIGFCCCIIPGLFFMARLINVETAIMDDEELPFLDAFKKSWQMTKGNTMSLIWLGILIVIINIIGACCCCVGLLFTLSLTYFAQALVYVVLKEKMADPFVGE